MVYYDGLAPRQILREAIRLLRQRVVLYLEEPHYSGPHLKTHDLSMRYVDTDRFRTLNEFSHSWLVPTMCLLGDRCCAEYPDGVSFLPIDRGKGIFETYDGVVLFMDQQNLQHIHMTELTFSVFLGPGSWLM